MVHDDARIGNFVELVRTTIGHNVRIHHVSYLGDATVEDEVNIGAGTITANFDGTAKLPTTIGKGAFIGCDTILVAPVRVGSGAVTGAGSVILKGHDVPNRGVVVGVPARPLEKSADETNGAAVKKAAPPRRVAMKRPAKGKKLVRKTSKPSATKLKGKPKAKTTAKAKRR